MEILQKIFDLPSRLSRSFKVTGTDTDRSATYDFLLVFSNDCSPIWYHFRDKENISKILRHPCKKTCI